MPACGHPRAPSASSSNFLELSPIDCLPLLHQLLNDPSKHRSQSLEMSSGAACNQELDIFTCTLQTCCREQGYVVYAPAIASNITYLVIFAVFFCIQTGLGLRYKTWGFLIGMSSGMILEVRLRESSLASCTRVTDGILRSLGMVGDTHSVRTRSISASSF